MERDDQNSHRKAKKKNTAPRLSAAFGGGSGDEATPVQKKRGKKIGDEGKSVEQADGPSTHHHGNHGHSHHAHKEGHSHGEKPPETTLEKMKSMFFYFKNGKKADADKNKQADNSGVKPLSKNQRKAKARKNWAILRNHVRNMRFKINFLAFSNDEAEMTKKIMGYDADQPIPDSQFDETGVERKEEANKTFLQQIIILPPESTLIQIWEITIYLLLFAGYFYNMIVVAFYLDTPESKLYQDFHTWVDIIFVISIGLKFITAYQKDVEWVTDLRLIILNNLRQKFPFDLIATLPGLITAQNKRYYWFKLARFIHIRDVFSKISNMLKQAFQKTGMNKSVTDKANSIINIFLIMFTSIVLLSSIWINIGFKFRCQTQWELGQRDPNFLTGTWLDCNCAKGTDGVTDPDECALMTAESSTIFVTAVYWVITTLTTVGYGDIKGYHIWEYIFQMIVEFLGIALFSFLMGSINNIVVSEQKLQDIIDDRIEDLDIWLRRLDKSRSKILPKNLYDSIKDFVEKSFYFDYNLIRTQEFFDQLKPKIRYKLVKELFNGFYQNFEYMFDDDEYGFDGGREFICDFLSNLYSRIYLPGNDIIQYGDDFPELYMIQEGIVILSLKGIGPDNEFFILPTYSYFGDYQILYDLKSQIVFKSGESKHLITMCLKKSKLKELMEDYPDARRFYMSRAWHRRIELRRRMKKHQRKLLNHSSLKTKKPRQAGKSDKEKTDNGLNDVGLGGKGSEDSENESHSSFDDSEGSGSEDQEESELEEFSGSNSDSDEIAHNKDKKKKREMNDKYKSKFFFDVEPITELTDDIEIEELERISADEQTENREDILKERNKKKSQQNAENIQQQMIQLGHAFARMNQSLGKNLVCVNKHIQNLLNGKNITDEEPELESLSLILNALTLQLQEKIKNLNQSKNIENALGDNLLKKIPGLAPIGALKSGEVKNPQVGERKGSETIQNNSNAYGPSSKQQKSYVDYESDH